MSEPGLELGWPAQRKTIRADTLPNPRILRLLLSFTVCFLVLGYGCLLLPNTELVLTYVPDKYESIDIMDLHDVSPLNQYIDVYLGAVNGSEGMDVVEGVEVWELREGQEAARHMGVMLGDVAQFAEIAAGGLRYYVGGVGVLDGVAYRVKVVKPARVKARALQADEGAVGSEGSLKNLQEEVIEEGKAEDKKEVEQQIAEKQQQGRQNSEGEKQNNGEQGKTGKEEQQQIGQQEDEKKKQQQSQQRIRKQQQQRKAKQQEQRQRLQQQQKRQQEEEKRKAQEQARQKAQQQEKRKAEQQQRRKAEQQAKRQTQEQQKRKAQQQQARRQAQQEQKRKAQQEAKRKAQQQARRIAQQQAKRIAQQQAQKQRLILQHTNMLVQIHMFAPASTVVQLVIRYVSILMIIYIVADNNDSPKILAFICTLYSNPLLFLQVSYPNALSLVMAACCDSAPLLYLSIWLYYIHTNIKYPDARQHRTFLYIKLTLSLCVYLCDVLRRLNMPVLWLQTVLVMVVLVLLAVPVWEAYLNLPYQQHRDKVLGAVTAGFVGCGLAGGFVAGSWSAMLGYGVGQTYGLVMMYLMAGVKSSTKKVGGMEGADTAEGDQERGHEGELDGNTAAAVGASL